jgi:hypothetical protein
MRTWSPSRPPSKDRATPGLEFDASRARENDVDLLGYSVPMGEGFVVARFQREVVHADLLGA